jgi:hypothetical protein
LVSGANVTSVRISRLTGAQGMGWQSPVALHWHSKASLDGEGIELDAEATPQALATVPVT